MILRHPYLCDLANRIDQYGGPVQWSDLYSAQWLLDTEEALRSQLDQAPLARSQSRALAQAVVILNYALYQGQVSVPVSQMSAYVSVVGNVDTQELCDTLAAAVCCARAEDYADASTTALIRDDDRVYLLRWWLETQRLSEQLKQRLPCSASAWSPSLYAYFIRLCDLPAPDSPAFDTQCHAQDMAVAHALSHRLTLVSGGPGTGKTTTAARMLQALVFQFHEERSTGHAPWPRVRLLAPTGKAAVRLETAILAQLAQSASKGSEQAAELALHVQGASMTIHRFLAEHGALDEERHHFGEALQARVWQAHDERNAAVDIAIVDESSMLDIKLANKLCALLPPSCRLVFLGDPYQLPPVEPGAVFADWVARWHSAAGALMPAQRVRQWMAGQQSNAAAPLCALRKTYRFGGALKELADAVREGSYSALQQVFSDHASGQELALHGLGPLGVTHHPLRERYCEAYRGYFELAAAQAPAEELAAAFAHFQLLGAQYDGPWGVHQFNRDIERHFRGGVDWYHGRALLITQNQAELGIFNGDIGFVVQCEDGQGGHWFEVHFPDSSEADEPLVIAPSRLKSWQPAYAMTVHKSQGSEYQGVMCVLAPYGDDMLTRALLYTAITRAKQRCEVVAEAHTLKKIMATSYALIETPKPVA